METLFLVLSLSSIGVMLYALYKAFVLRHRVPRGKVRSTWNFLSGLIVMFTVGYFPRPSFAFCLPNSKMCSSE